MYQYETLLYILKGIKTWKKITLIVNWQKGKLDQNLRLNLERVSEREKENKKIYINNHLKPVELGRSWDN